VGPRVMSNLTVAPASFWVWRPGTPWERATSSLRRPGDARMKGGGLGTGARRVDRRHPDGVVHRRGGGHRSLDATAVLGASLTGTARARPTSGPDGRALSRARAGTSPRPRRSTSPPTPQQRWQREPYATAPVALACLGDDDALVSQHGHFGPDSRRPGGPGSLRHMVRGDRPGCPGRHGRPGRCEGGTSLLPPPAPYWEARIAEAVAGPASRFVRTGSSSGRSRPPWPPSFIPPCHRHALPAPRGRPPGRRPHRQRHDTVAAIAGAWLGARWGATACPPNGRCVARLARLPQRGPGAPGRAERQRGRSDETGCRRLTRSPLLPTRVRLGGDSRAAAEDPGLVMSNVFGAMATAADITVSLCRMGAPTFLAARWSRSACSTRTSPRTTRTFISFSRTCPGHRCLREAARPCSCTACGPNDAPRPSPPPSWPSCAACRPEALQRSLPSYQGRT